MASPVKNYEDPRSPGASSRDYSTARNYPETTTTTYDDRSSRTNHGNDGSPQKSNARRDSTAAATSASSVPVIREPIELSEPRVPEIYDPAYKRPTTDNNNNNNDNNSNSNNNSSSDEPRAAAEWDFLGSSKQLSTQRPRSDVSSTGAVANNVIAPRHSISERKRQLALGSLRARPDEEDHEAAIVEESDEQVKENLAKANLNLTLNELLTRTKISGEDGS
ncbi:hypothetical protein MGN70_011876 [Eutypa lata]|nr:hypothetical protein MGN70_011876 [Eutypa lata]